MTNNRVCNTTHGAFYCRPPKRKKSQKLANYVNASRSWILKERIMTLIIEYYIISSGGSTKCALYLLAYFIRGGIHTSVLLRFNQKPLQPGQYTFIRETGFLFFHIVHTWCVPPRGTSARVKVEVVFRVYLRAECRAVNGHNSVVRLEAKRYMREHMCSERNAQKDVYVRRQIWKEIFRKEDSKSTF